MPIPNAIDDALTKIRSRALRALLRGRALAWLAAGLAVEFVVRLIQDITKSLDDSTLTDEQLQAMLEDYLREHPFQEQVVSGVYREPRTAQVEGFEVTEPYYTEGGQTYRTTPPVRIGPNAPPPLAISITKGRGLATRLRPYLIAGAGILAAGLLSRSSRSAGARGTRPASTPTTTPSTPTGALPAYLQAGYLTSFSGGGVISTDTTKGCECKPKKRKKPRKCLERAQVSWRTGRYKGKLAGTKCVRWARS